MKGILIYNNLRTRLKKILIIICFSSLLLTYGCGTCSIEKVGFVPIGTIVASYLDWSEFQNTSGNNSTSDEWSSQYSKWSPADGREVLNSNFYKIANQNRVPDLRGVFIRGLNQFDDGYLPADEKQKDSETRVRGSYQSDGIKEHTHKLVDHDNLINNVRAAYRHPSDKLEGGTSWERAVPFDLTIRVSSEGEGLNKYETRPKNVALYYYIRIN